MSLPEWFQGDIPTELLRLARAHCEERVHRQILADWVERYGGEEGRLLCRFFRRDEVLRNDASTWQTLSASEARLVAPFSDLVLGIGDRVELPLTETQNITMGWVPPGQSWLGGGDKGPTAYKLEKGLWCGIYPVTQEQWHSVMGNNPSHFSGNRKNPVEQVSWKDANLFLQKLNGANNRSDFLYRLPTADEWEYILRGGPIPKSQSQYYFYFARSKTDLTAVGSNDLSSTQANFNGNYPYGSGKDGPFLETTSAVGNYLPNPLGMYDMHGNVWEWTSTKRRPARVVYGGSWCSGGVLCSAWTRSGYYTNERDFNIGFRLFAVPVGPSKTRTEQNLPVAISSTTVLPKIVNRNLPLPEWFQGEIPTELLRLARAHCEERKHRQILGDWVERYGGEEGQLLCRFLRRDEVLRNDASTWQTLSASEARLVAPFSDLVLGIGDRVVLPLTETQNITMGWVPPGQSWLGGGGEEGTTAFMLELGLWCGIYPVTQEQWDAVMGNNPSHFSGNPKNPVEQVSWEDASLFLQKLNAVSSRSGFLYRLPTADEWEYILRGGPISKSQSEYHYYFAFSKTDLTAVASNDLPSTQANFDGNYPAGSGKKGPYLETTSAVGNYLPNPLGMYDMHGNVWEWTSTEEGSERVHCGGGYCYSGEHCEASYRDRSAPDDRFNILGFRLLAVPVGR